MTMRKEISRARELRHEQTEAESRAWWLLRNRAVGGFKFRRQHPAGPFFADFYCPKLMLILELEGSVHSQPSVLKADTSRDEYLKEEGYRVVHFSNSIVLKAPEVFVEKVKALCQERLRELRGKHG
jgi:very-short-patch-repair endonuclease